MRLIDADALNLEYEVDMADDWKTAHEMANIVKYAPTVDAIPISYIEEQAKLCERIGLIRIEQALMILIEDWREEHDKAG